MIYVKTIMRFVVTTIIASVIVFLLLRVIPGDPAVVALGVTASPEAIAALQAKLGTDQPLWVQYSSWVAGMLRGDFGVSMSSGLNISPLLIDSFQVSFILVSCSIGLAVALAVPLAVWTLRKGGTIVSWLSQIGIAIPSFLTAILLVAVFSIYLGWFPSRGWVPPNQNFGAFFRHLILPVIALSAVQAAILTRYMRAALLDVLGEDYIRTALSKGMSLNRAIMIHALPNAILPVLTVTGMQLATLLVGAVVIEQVFSLPGIGSVLLESVANRDLLVVQSVVMVLVVFTLLINLMIDLLYSVLDPRISK